MARVHITAYPYATTHGVINIPEEVSKDKIATISFIQDHWSDIHFDFPIKLDYNGTDFDIDEMEDEESITEHENKREICIALCAALKMTRNQTFLKDIEYVNEENGEEYAILHWCNGYTKKICITCDSGIAMIYDIVANLH